MYILAKIQAAAKRRGFTPQEISMIRNLNRELGIPAELLIQPYELTQSLA
ncbi:MAG: hypothetical protein SW833_07880 [Cyanobacteriota bacterium]|nr:hypothetical protein [Cyanobacteriota bacterium]